MLEDIFQKTSTYLRYLNVPNFFGAARTKEILSINPTRETQRVDDDEVIISSFLYNKEKVAYQQYQQIEGLFAHEKSDMVQWVNINGIRKTDVEKVCKEYGIHLLLQEDILSIQQRPKFDEVENVVLCLLNILSWQEDKKKVHIEQLSILLGKKFVITFQDDAKHDLFESLREKLKSPTVKARERGPDYLTYMLLDLIVDNYFQVMESLSNRIEDLEDEVIRKSTPRSLVSINDVRKELIVLKRNVVPVRDLLANVIRSESQLINDLNNKYFKDIQDHIVQAIELCENYRDIMINVQDLYMSGVNMKTNEVMKVMTMVTCLLAPATVIGGIFGMNFDKIPYLHSPYGFAIAVSLMLFVPVWMLRFFRKRGWF